MSISTQGDDGRSHWNVPNTLTWLRILMILGICTAAIAAAMGGLYWSCQQMPDFYVRALAQDRTTAESAGNDLLRQAANLAGDVRRPGRWQALFTAEQINGWLAMDAQPGHGRMLSPQISNPRVGIENDRAQIAFRWSKPIWSAIVHLETEVYLQSENVVAVRICKARAGWLPLPLGALLEDLISAGRDIGFAIEQQQIEGDPLLLVTLPAAYDRSNKLICLESLELTPNEIYVAGRCERGGCESRSLVREPGDSQKSADQAQVEKANLQR
jgi:hypothetical protein